MPGGGCRSQPVELHFDALDLGLRTVVHLRDAVRALEGDLDVVPFLEKNRAVQLQAIVQERVFQPIS